MFQGFGPGLIPFFLDIRFHNDRTFMEANRARYIRDVREPFYAFIDAIAPYMQAIDPEFEVRPAKCLSRINRDTRFSKDKSPYRDHLWLAFRRAAGQKEGLPFYWLEIAPESVTWGLGIWGENRGMMDVMRARMAARPDDFWALLPILQKNGFSIEGDEFKRLEVPPGIPEVLWPWYKKRSIYLQKQQVQLDWIYSADIVERVAADYAALSPFYQLFRGCIDQAMNLTQNEGGNEIL